MPSNELNKPEGEERKRGRPAGKNRIPLSLDERRRRNAKYERERREEQAKGYIELAQALGADEEMSHCDLLASAIQFLSREKDLEAEKIANKQMRKRIAELEKEIANERPRRKKTVDNKRKKPDPEPTDEPSVFGTPPLSESDRNNNQFHETPPRFQDHLFMEYEEQNDLVAHELFGL